ncbi:hypothetical protein B0H12DRAFT_1068829 [Mycena haematopus]|nr:hypothetical protein B0H12DRAFT_1068829 [Mycena haematopus]
MPSRARLYQTTLEEFYARNPFGSVDQPTSPLSLPPPRVNGRAPGELFTHRCFVPGAGRASAPIDVDEWDALAPIDVDASPQTADGAKDQTSKAVGMPSPGQQTSLPVPSLTTSLGHSACMCSATRALAAVLHTQHRARCVVRDSLFERELEAAIEEGIVKTSGAVGRRRPYTWSL